MGARGRWRSRRAPSPISTTRTWAGSARSASTCRFWPVPVEVADAIPFAQRREASRRTTASAAHDFWRALTQASRVLEIFRGRFVGKVEPRAFLLGELRSRVHALQRCTRAAASGRRPGARGLGDARGVLARMHQRADGGPARSAARSRSRCSTPTPIRSRTGVPRPGSVRMPARIMT